MRHHCLAVSFLLKLHPNKSQNKGGEVSPVACVTLTMPWGGARLFFITSPIPSHSQKLLLESERLREGVCGSPEVLSTQMHNSSLSSHNYRMTGQGTFSF